MFAQKFSRLFSFRGATVFDPYVSSGFPVMGQLSHYYSPSLQKLKESDHGSCDCRTWRLHRGAWAPGLACPARSLAPSGKSPGPQVEVQLWSWCPCLKGKAEIRPPNLGAPSRTPSAESSILKKHSLELKQECARGSKLGPLFGTPSIKGG